MNERIRQLAEQAGIVNRKFSFGQWWENDLTTEQKKFAELIVKECVRCIDDGRGEVSSMAEHGWRQICQKEIKEHFGVKE